MTITPLAYKQNSPIWQPFWGGTNSSVSFLGCVFCQKFSGLWEKKTQVEQTFLSSLSYFGYVFLISSSLKVESWNKKNPLTLCPIHHSFSKMRRIFKRSPYFLEIITKVSREMTWKAEVIFSLHLLHYANLLQVSIRKRLQVDPCDLMFWVTVIRNLTDQIKNKPLSTFHYWRPTSKTLNETLFKTFSSQNLTAFVDSPFRDVLMTADHWLTLLRRLEAIAGGRNCVDRAFLVLHVHLLKGSAVKVNQTWNVALKMPWQSSTGQLPAKVEPGGGLRLKLLSKAARKHNIFLSRVFQTKSYRYCFTILFMINMPLHNVW